MAKKRTKKIDHLSKTHKKYEEKKLGKRDIQKMIKDVEQQYKVHHSNIAQLTQRIKKDTEQALIKKGEHQALRNIEKRLSNNIN